MRITDLNEHVIDDKAMIELTAARVKGLMARDGMDALVVISPDSFRYLTGLPMIHSLYMASVNAAILHGGADLPAILGFEGFGSKMQARAPWFNDVADLPFQGTGEGMQPFVLGSWPDIFATKIRDLKLDEAVIAVDPTMPYALKEGIAAKLPNCRLVDAGKLLREARMVKNAEEIKALRSACLLSEIAIEAGIDVVRAGADERAIAAAIEYSFRINGAENPGFTPLIMSGMHALTPYSNPSQKVVRNGELVRIDIGCCSHGYNSCFGRTVVVGNPHPDVLVAYEAVKAAILAGIAAVGPGTTNVAVHAAMADAMKESSAGRHLLADYGGHGLGTGLHEDPMIGAEGTVEKIVLEAGMCIALEPSIILPDHGWLGVEDNVVVSENGCEVLTRTAFDLGLAPSFTSQRRRPS
ncbi:M24 family metallopeptidase [Sphingosinicella microcystinivorans]|uniref:M24 family metallopeptidase n=1 Tax=Sphingosinicella microcystinivorans TaxID=335406 RepID=UPI0022F3A6F3|nr:Xaa-Pro peptidase family protein [Sphingosinicella microcystinivorans]WBX85598.1 Xaa-Pro peptidase family protein [Sphingosinicella microcystinivorans]